jgi:hypothetical protein
MSENDDIYDAVQDAERTLSKKSRGAGRFTVRAIEVEWLEYDEERDGLFLAQPRRVVRMEFDPTEKEG